jgi:energy-coupling factor transport system substrate-specific component
MRELLSMWKNTRMVVMVAVSAACYVAVLLPFKIAVIIPGLTEIRPGAAVPILLSFIFGPAAAWGSGFGNVIADILGGMFGPGSLFGFVGNFLYGFLPYALWRAWRGRARPGQAGIADWFFLGFIILVSSMAIGVVIGWGADLLGLAPFAALGNIIFLNNLLTSLILALPLIALIYPRVEKAGLAWHELMDESDIGSGRFRKLALVLVPATCFAAMIAGNLISFGLLDAQFGASGFGGESGHIAVSGGLAPFILLLLAGCFLL